MNETVEAQLCAREAEEAELARLWDVASHKHGCAALLFRNAARFTQDRNTVAALEVLAMSHEERAAQLEFQLSKTVSVTHSLAPSADGSTVSDSPASASPRLFKGDDSSAVMHFTPAGMTVRHGTFDVEQSYYRSAPLLPVPEYSEETSPTSTTSTSTLPRSRSFEKQVEPRALGSRIGKGPSRPVVSAADIAQMREMAADAVLRSNSAFRPTLANRMPSEPSVGVLGDLSIRPLSAGERERGHVWSHVWTGMEALLDRLAAIAENLALNAEGSDRKNRVVDRGSLSAGAKGISIDSLEEDIEKALLDSNAAEDFWNAFRAKVAKETEKDRSRSPLSAEALCDLVTSIADVKSQLRLLFVTCRRLYSPMDSQELELRRSTGEREQEARTIAELREENEKQSKEIELLKVRLDDAQRLVLDKNVVMASLRSSKRKQELEPDEDQIEKKFTVEVPNSLESPGSKSSSPPTGRFRSDESDGLPSPPAELSKFSFLSSSAHISPEGSGITANGQAEAVRTVQARVASLQDVAARPPNSPLPKLPQ